MARVRAVSRPPPTPIPPRARPGTKQAPVAGLTLYTAAAEPWNDWAALAFAEKDVDEARTERVSPERPSEDLLVINPELRLPALADREVLIVGARVIAEYLDERYPHPRLLPQDPGGRAKVRMVLERFAVELFPALVEAQAAKVIKAKSTLARQLTESARWFGKAYFLGNDYTQADLAWAVWLKGVARLGATLPEPTAAYAQKLAGRPVLAAYFKAA
jgi:RNA polymerase-associated protein